MWSAAALLPLCLVYGAPRAEQRSDALQGLVFAPVLKS